MGRKRLHKKKASRLDAAATLVEQEIAPAAECDLLKRLATFRAQFRAGRDSEKVLKAALRLSLDFFNVPQGCIAVVRPENDHATILHPIPKESWWDQELLAGFLRGRKVRVPTDTMLARIRRFDRMWGALVVHSPGTDLRWNLRQAFSSIGAVCGELIDRIDQERIREVRARVDQNILEQVRPKNLFYKLLHGIRSLTGYDHSSALLICDGRLDSLEIVAEQIAWQKAKSRHVGRKLTLTGPMRDLLRNNTVYGFDRHGRHWQDWSNLEASLLAELLDYNNAEKAASGALAENAMLCAPLVTREGVLGLLKVSGTHAGAFGRYEAELISRFLPQAAVALQNSRRTESLELQMVAAERKHAMADLARGVSHDINNALGSVLPLVQQLQADLEEETFDTAVAALDLHEIERSLQVCRRIFGGMLRFARSASRNVSEVSLHQAVDCALAIFKQGLEQRKIRLRVDVPPDLPLIKGIQADVEQLVLNLVSNARDAMDAGDTLTLAGVQRAEVVELVIEDTGIGIAAEDLGKIQEPFFTTKETGNGLGLAICRSITAQIGGKFEIDSKPGEGTRVTLSFQTI